MKTEIELFVQFKEKEIIKTIYESTKPDNEIIPDSLYLKMYYSQDTLILKLISENKIDTMINTVQEILSDFQLIIKIINKINLE